MDNFFKLILLSIVKVYRYLVSPLVPARCRFYPTCSQYAVEALTLHGGFRGGWLVVKRVCRCHPWGGSGIDFVPLPLYRYHYQFIQRPIRDRGVLMTYSLHR